MLTNLRRWRPFAKLGKPTEQTNFSVPVLCYHSWQLGDNYTDDNHFAMEQDLRTLASMGYQILPTEQLIAVLSGKVCPSNIANRKLACITFDDGKRWDFYDGVRSNGSKIKSFRRILTESQNAVPTHLNGARSLAFVIASPDARNELSQAFSEPPDYWTHDWWKKSAKEGIVGVANHSWDHVHDALKTVRQAENKKGSFFNIETYPDAHAQIAEAQTIIDKIAGKKRISVLGYPYGHAPSYLREEFLPTYGPSIGLKGAMSTAGRAVTNDTNIWDIPRFVCGHHWKTPTEFSELIRSTEASS